MSCAHGAASLVLTHTVHLRLPAIEPGVKAFVWALLLSLYVWGFLLAVGVDKGTSTVLGLISFGAIFLSVRVFGESEEP
jgi:hydrogenase/urease accessory protein HupE